MSTATFGDARLPTDFWARVEQADSCWLWIGAFNVYGYGVFRRNREQAMAHRVSYARLVAEIPTGYDIDHMCHATACVNPSHLQTATRAINLQNRKGANRSSKLGVRGVYFDKRRGSYSVEVTLNRKKHFGGRFDTLAEAEAAAIALRNRLFTNNLVDRRSA